MKQTASKAEADSKQEEPASKKENKKEIKKEIKNKIENKKEIEIECEEEKEEESHCSVLTAAEQERSITNERLKNPDHI